MRTALNARRTDAVSSRIGSRLLLRGAGAGACMLAVHARPASCSKSGSSDPSAQPSILGGVWPGAGGPVDASEPTGALAERCVRLAWPVISRLGCAGMLGACCALAFKRMTKSAAVYVGGAVVVLQILAQLGFVTVHWERLQALMVVASDVDNLTHLTRRGLAVLSGGMPVPGPFAPCSGSAWLTSRRVQVRIFGAVPSQCLGGDCLSGTARRASCHCRSFPGHCNTRRGMCCAVRKRKASSVLLRAGASWSWRSRTWHAF